MEIIRKNLTATVIKQIGDISLIEFADGTLTLYNERTNKIIIDIDKYEILPTTSDKFFVLKNRSDRVFIYDATERKLIVDDMIHVAHASCLFGLLGGNFKKIISVILKSPLSNKFQIFDEINYGTKNSLFDKEIDEVISLNSDRYCSYFVLSHSNKKGLYRISFGMVKGLDFECDNIREESGRLVLTVNNKEYLANVRETSSLLSPLGSADKYYFLDCNSCKDINGKVRKQRWLVKQDGRKHIVFDREYNGEGKKVDSLLEIECDEICYISHMEDNKDKEYYKKYWCDTKVIYVVVKGGDYFKIIKVKNISHGEYKTAKWLCDSFGIIFESQNEEIASFKVADIKERTNGQYDLISDDGKKGYYDIRTQTYVEPKYTRIEKKHVNGEEVLCLYLDDEYCDIVSYSNPDSPIVKCCKIISIEEKNNIAESIIFQYKNGLIGILSLFVETTANDVKKEFIVKEGFTDCKKTKNNLYRNGNIYCLHDTVGNVGIYRNGYKDYSLPLEYKEILVHDFEYGCVAYICKEHDDRYSLKFEFNKADCEKDFEISKYARDRRFVEILYDDNYVLLRGDTNANLYDWKTGKLVYSFSSNVRVAFSEVNSNKSFVEFEDEDKCYKVKKQGIQTSLISIDKKQIPVCTVDIKTCLGRVKIIAPPEQILRKIRHKLCGDNYQLFLNCKKSPDDYQKSHPNLCQEITCPKHLSRRKWTARKK